MAPNPKFTLGHVLVVGGCGFLGHNIVSLILSRYPKSRVAVLDRRTSLNRIDSDKITYHDGDITNLEELRTLFQKLKPDVVIHTAAITPDSGASNAALYKVNVDGTKNLLTAARETDVKAFVYTSSSSVVVGRVGGVVRADETWPILTGKDQPEYYTATKALGEIATLEANRASPNFLTASVRPATIFGDGDHLTLWRMLLITGFKARFQLGENDNLFDFTYVKNVAHGHLLAAEALLQTHALGTVPLDTERVDGEAFFITNDSPVYFWDFFRRVVKETGRDPAALDPAKIVVLGTTVAIVIATILEVVMGIFGKAPNFSRLAVKQSCMTRYFSIEKAKTRLRYAPLYSLEEGIKRGVAEILPRQAALAEKKTQ